MIPGASVDEVLLRIEEAERRAPGGAVAFDGDGTLWSGDVGEDFFAAAVASDRLTPLAREALAREAREHAVAVEEDLDAAALARRIHAAYMADAFPEERMCEIVTWVTAGWTVAELDAFCARVCEGLDLPSRLHPETIAVLRWADARAIPVHLVSASPRAIVAQAAKVVGIDPARIVAAREAVLGERVAPAAVRPIPYGPGKVTRLREQLGPRPLHAAFGDNVFDAAMLREAAVPVAIRPKPRLVARAAEVPGLRRLLPPDP